MDVEVAPKESYTGTGTGSSPNKSVLISGSNPALHCVTSFSKKYQDPSNIQLAI
jgi:hypothetical protein